MAAIWPNPFQEELHLYAQFIKGGEVTIDLTDLHGRVLATPYEGRVSAGEFKLDWNAPADLAEGVYLFRIRKMRHQFVPN